MKVRTLGSWIAVTTVFALATSSLHAGDRGPVYEDWQRNGHRPSDIYRAPLKDCTRFAGRYGYYGNPWCTPAEQERWDRWEARQLDRSRKMR